MATIGEYLALVRALPPHGTPLLVERDNPIACLARENIVRKTLDDFLGGEKSNKKNPTLRGLCDALKLVFGGDEEDRTPDLRIANAALSQLSYIPEK